MPWKNRDYQQRLKFVSAATQPQVNFRRLCQESGISAPTGYKWLRRYQNLGGKGLLEHSRQPRRSPQKFRSAWREELFALRRKHPRWGVKKLRIRLAHAHPRARKLPSLRTLGRWLSAAALTRASSPRSRPGPQIERPALTVPARANDVWTVDFKGWFRTGDGRRCEPLTIRDLASRYLLCATVVATPGDEGTRRIMTPLFKRCGLPRVIRVDNGSPFAGQGSLNLTRLSLWWVRLGIRVEFTRRGKPQDNGAHEQMHRILKADTAAPPAANLRAQQRRLDRWRREYNSVRPHEALQGRVPAALYRASRRRFHVPAAASYRASWQTRHVRANGWIKFQGRLRFVGRAFVRQIVGLEPIEPGIWNVRLDRLLIGTLHQSDGSASMRHAQYLCSKPSQKPAPRNAADQSQCKGCRGHEV